MYVPITPVTHSARPSASVAVCLAVLVTLICGTLLLVFLKRVYIHQSRRVNQARQNSILSLPMSSTDSVPSDKEKNAGFIVGFLGSPSVEIQCALDKAEWKENKQSSFTYQIHTDSRRHRLEYPSVLDISSRLHRRTISSPRAGKKPVLPESHSFKLPPLPDKAHLPPHSRRFSLPNMNRGLAYDASRRRHSSLKSARSRRSTFSPNSLSSKTALSSAGRDTPLPLSPRPSEDPTTSPAPSPISASSPFSPKTGSRLSRSFIPQLPSFPFMSSPPSTTQRASAFQISHPYALSAHPRKADPKLPDQVYYQSALVLATDIDRIPLERPLMSPAPSPALSSFPSPAPIVGILKPKLKVRTRRSPVIGAIGPSPLRSMILPDSFDSEISSHAQIRFSQSAYSPCAAPGAALGQSDVKSSLETNAGIAKSASNSIVPNTRRRQNSVSSHHASGMDDDDPDVLLGILRELVEETSDWDQSTVFMNQSFKNLLQETGITPTKSAREGFVEAEVVGPGKKPDSGQSVRPDVNLELLGLDFFRSESFYDDQTSKADDATKLVSFWDEDSGNRSREIVGLAW
ncbi:hypothetical protein K438DRAFT_788043 [Mycena galopus ATCC 62051]|nr:hypothetical protein K438DRAFT_788043 [Mycena galopus ATCC 62051]